MLLLFNWEHSCYYEMCAITSTVYDKSNTSIEIESGYDLILQRKDHYGSLIRKFIFIYL